MADGFTFYTENAGLPSLRRAIAAYYRKLHGVELDPAREIVITASGVQALNVGIRCVLDPGDEALVLTPAWPNGSSIVAMANAMAQQIPHPLRGGRYAIDFDALEAAVTPRTRLLLYTSPSNPLGWVATEDEQERLLDFSRRHGLWLLADEVYDRLYYAGGRLGEPVPSILRKATRDDAVMVVHSFSKSYCMTGWRVGYLIARARPGRQGHAVERVHHFARAEFRPEGRRDRARRRRGRTGAHARAAEGEPRSLSGRPGSHARASTFPSPMARFISFPRSRAWRIRSSSAGACCSRRASDSRPEWPSARAAKARCASATPPNARSSSRRWSGSDNLSARATPWWAECAAGTPEEPLPYGSRLCLQYPCARIPAVKAK